MRGQKKVLDFGPGNVLVLGAHPDDEMGCAGLLFKLKKSGAHISHAVFSDCAVSTVARGFPADQLLRECEASRDLLGVAPESRFNFNFPVRHFPQNRQEILETLVGLNRSLKPDLVLTAASTDIHQDHKTLTEEALRVFKHVSVLGYELPWNNMTFDNDCFVTLSEEDVKSKLELIACYATQKDMIYTRERSTITIAQFRGLQANCDYAECYQVLRLKL